MDATGGALTLTGILGLAVMKYFELKKEKLRIEEKAAEHKEKSAAEQSILRLSEKADAISKALSDLDSRTKAVEEKLQERHDNAIKLWSDRCQRLESEQFKTVLEAYDLSRRVADNCSKALADVYGFMEDRLGS